MFRLSLPERIPIAYAFLFASTLFLFQQIEHTSVYFSACGFLFIVLSTQAFNIAGGLSRPSGGYIFFYAVLGVILGIVVKAFLGEPADSNLLRPHLTITIYAVSSLMLLLAAWVSRRFSRKRSLLGKVVSDHNMPNAAIGCLVIGVTLTILSRVTIREEGSALSALVQINRFSQLAIILGVTSVLRRSAGRKSFNVPVLLACGASFVLDGLVGFSKEGLFTPGICWLLAAAARRYRISAGQFIGGVLLTIFSVMYLVPYSQYGRTVQAATITGSLKVAAGLLNNLNFVRQEYLASANAEAEEVKGGYFDKPHGLFDRLQMISFDDQLNDATERRGPEGYFPLLVDLENLVPHALWPGKPSYLWGNVYAHEAGINLAEDDTSTGVSFSPSGEAYHLDKWVGVLVIAPFLWSLLFLVFDSLCGDVRDSPWGLLVVSYFAHMAPEGMLASIIYAMWYMTFAITFAALTSGYVLPHLGALFVCPTGRPMPQRTRPPAARKTLE